MDQDSCAGAATGKLWRWIPGGMAAQDQAPDPGRGELFFNPPGGERILDSTGIYFTPAQRHLDRGSGESDKGQYQNREYVFGASGAAAFYRHEMLDAVKIGREYFDEDFFAYREDADLAWRAQWLGWKCLYVPEARGYHVRRVLPERRSQLPPAINMHSFKNRFLLRVKNMDLGTYARFFLPITLRDLGALAYVFTREPSSLRAFPLLLKALPRAWSARKALQRHRRVSAAELRTWFSNHPAARPVSPHPHH
jgi:GT2 family glycosyltransferase